MAVTNRLPTTGKESWTKQLILRPDPAGVNQQFRGNRAICVLPKLYFARPNSQTRPLPSSS